MTTPCLILTLLSVAAAVFCWARYAESPTLPNLAGAASWTAVTILGWTYVAVAR